MSDLMFSWITPAGRVEDNRLTTTLVNNTEKTASITVPANKRWVLMGGMIHNADNVTRVCQVVIYNPSDQIVLQIFYASLGAAVRGYFPMQASDTYRSSLPLALVLEAGYYAKYTWKTGGASTGGTAEYTFLVLEIDS